MNCKPGDIAYLCKAWKPEDKKNLGKIVTVVKRWDDGPLGASWIVDPSIAPWAAIWDQCLRPIRDEPGEDETLSWKSVPKPGLDRVDHEQEAQHTCNVLR